MNPEIFKRAANNFSKISYTDPELFEQLSVYECLLAYFRARGNEHIICYALQLEFNTLESYASARGLIWKK